MSVYRHLDLKKYVKLKYKPLTALSTSIVFLIVYIFYYIANKYLNIFNLILAIIYSIVIDRKIVLLIILRLKNKNILTNKKIKLCDKK